MYQDLCFTVVLVYMANEDTVLTVKPVKYQFDMWKVGSVAYLYPLGGFPQFVVIYVSGVFSAECKGICPL